MRQTLNHFTVILLSVLFLAFFSSLEARAMVQAPTLRFGLGYSSLSFHAGSLTSKSSGTSSDLGANAQIANSGAKLPLSIKFTLNPMFLWDVPTARMRIGVHFLADVGSTYGFLTTTGVGLTAIFYPLGLSSFREVKDDGSIMTRNRVGPYFQAAVTPAKFSVTFPQTDAEIAKKNVPVDYFSAYIIETSLGVGVDYPFGEDLIGFFGIQYRFASFKDQESTTGTISYSGITALFGVMTNFF